METVPVSATTATAAVMDFTGKVVIVTGASSGIGAAAANLFAAHGALLSLVGRCEQRLLEVANTCQQSKGNQPLCILLDLTKEGSCDEIVRKTVETYNRIDVLINSAGKMVLTSIFDSNLEVFDDIMRLNLRVPYRLTQLCLPHLKKTKGNIVNVLGSARRACPGFLNFSMAREALERFTNAGGLELVSAGVRMNAVKPGLTKTRFMTNFNVATESLDRVYNMVASEVMPNKVPLDPEEIARTILFVASDQCPNMTSSCITVDGGQSFY